MDSPDDQPDGAQDFSLQDAGELEKPPELVNIWVDRNAVELVGLFATETPDNVFLRILTLRQLFA